MSAKDDGGPAFPVTGEDHRAWGISMRDYFAAKAMASMAPVYWQEVNGYESGEALIKCLSETAYEMADAMLETRNKPAE